MAAKKKTPAAAGATLYPVLPIIKPTDLTGQQNGYLTANILRTIQKPSGQLEKHAATAWNCLQLAAYFNGLTLNQVGAYRTYDQPVSHVQRPLLDQGLRTQTTSHPYLAGTQILFEAG
jgi:LAS superfamily LD-carboxypeptidase LdcB